MIVKYKQCDTCMFDKCPSRACHDCANYANKPLTPAPHVGGCDTYCRCLSVGLEEPCPYYTEVTADDKD